jgi:hypothetical protein
MLIDAPDSWQYIENVGEKTYNTNHKHKIAIKKTETPGCDTFLLSMMSQLLYQDKFTYYRYMIITH